MSENPWDKLLLIVVGVATLGVSGWFVTKALGFKDQFALESAAQKDDLPPTRTAQTTTAIKWITRTTEWDLMEVGTPPKPLPLFVSIPIVELNGVTIDMLDPNAQQLRPPTTNQWLYENNLDFLNKNVLRLDPDGDGYNNEEEWLGKTDPKDSNSHPPYADKLVLVDRKSQVYRAVFAARPDDKRFQIRRLPTSKWRPANYYVEIGGTTDDNQLRLDAFEEKQTRSSVGIMVDASVLKVTYLPKGTKHELVRNVAEDIHTYFAELEFLLEPGKTFFVKEGDTFPLARDPGTKYRVTEVLDDSATITYESAPGESKTVKITRK